MSVGTDQPPLLWALEGPSGAGKTTVSRLLARSIGGHRMDEAYWRLTPRPPLRFWTDSELLAIERVLFAEERRRARDAHRVLDRGRSVVLDTDFWGPLSYVCGLAALGQTSRRLTERIAEWYKGDQGRVARLAPDVLVYLSVPDRVARARAARSVRRHPARLRDRHLAVGRMERRLYLDAVRPVLGERFLLLPASGTPEDVVGRILRRAPKQLRPLARNSSLGRRVVDRIARASRTLQP